MSESEVIPPEVITGIEMFFAKFFVSSKFGKPGEKPGKKGTRSL